MSHRIIASLACSLLLAPAAAHATVMEGDFSGTIDNGTDVTGVFGTPGDLTGDSVTGTFTYNTALFSQVTAGGVNTATGTGIGALTVTLSINGHSHTFTDNTSAGLLLDTNASEATIESANSTGGNAENFFLDASDPITPFITSTSLTATWSTTNPFSSSGTFAIIDPGAGAGGAFTLGTFEVTGQAPSPTPEPAGMALLAVGLGGVAAVRRRRRTA